MSGDVLIDDSGEIPPEYACRMDEGVGVGGAVAEGRAARASGFDLADPDVNSRERIAVGRE